MRKRMGFTVVLIALSVSLFAAGSRESADPAAGSSGEPAARMTMIYWDPSQRDILEEINGLFVQEKPNVEIELQQVPSTEYDQVLRTRFLADNGPDVFMYYGVRSYMMARDGYFGDLSGEPWVDSVIDGYRGTVSYEGRIHALPLNGWANTVLYNKDVFEAAGVTELPETYADFLSIAERIQETGVVPIARGGKDTWTALHEVGPLYSHIFTSNPDFQMQLYTGEITFSTSPGMRTLLERYIELVDNGHIDTGILGVSHLQAMQQVADGDAGMVLGISVFYNEIVGANPDANIGSFQLPDDQGRIAIVGQSDKALGFWPGGSNTDLARDLIAFYARPDINRLYNETTQSVPALKDIQVDLAEPLRDVAQDLSTSEAIFNELVGHWPRPALDEYLRVIADIHTGNRDVTALLERLDRAYSENKDLVGPPITR